MTAFARDRLKAALRGRRFVLEVRFGSPADIGGLISAGASVLAAFFALLSTGRYWNQLVARLSCLNGAISLWVPPQCRSVRHGLTALTAFPNSAHCDHALGCRRGSCLD